MCWNKYSVTYKSKEHTKALFMPFDQIAYVYDYKAVIVQSDWFVMNYTSCLQFVTSIYRGILIYKLQ